MSESPSPFARPFEGLRIKEYSMNVPRPSAEEVAQFPEQARALLERIAIQQDLFLDRGEYKIDSLKGRHFLLAGATGPGLGGAIESAARRMTEKSGSVTVLARDLSKSVGYEMGRQMTERAEAAGMGNRYHLINEGMASEGPAFQKIVEALKDARADEIIYVNSVAAAMSGLLPGYPPIYVKDVDEEGLFQWKLTPLTEQAIENTRTIMGRLAVNFPRALEAAGFKVAVTCYIDWRGSLDVLSRDPESTAYGRQGPYSTSLYLPKEFLQADTIQAYGHGRKVLDCFLPVMRTRALGFIPGATPQWYLLSRLMDLSGIRRRDVPELALGVLDQIARALSGGPYNPFPRLDDHETPLDEWYRQIVLRLNNDENSEFYWKEWIKLDQ
ncbi:MAG: hypothetical protein ACOZB3_00670 [Calditrichota bacterium]